MSVWLRGSATNCFFNYGNFPHAVFVREFQSVTGVATAPPARVMPLEAGLAVTGEGR